MKLYRDLRPSEPVEVADEILVSVCHKNAWVPLTQMSFHIGKIPDDVTRARYRRPVIVPRDGFFVDLATIVGVTT